MRDKLTSKYRLDEGLLRILGNNMLFASDFRKDDLKKSKQKEGGEESLKERLKSLVWIE